MKKRMNLIFDEKTLERVVSLTEKTDSATWTETIRRALSIYDTLEKYRAEGWEIIVRHKTTKKEKTIELL